MATVKGINRTLADTPTSDNVLAPGTFGGRVRVMYDTYEAAALPAADLIEIGGTLKAGAIIVGIRVFFDDLGVGTTLDVGDTDTATRYDTAIDTATAAGDVWCDNIGGQGYVVGTNSGDTQVVLRNNAAAATGTIKVAIYYTED